MEHSRRVLAKADTANGWSDLTVEERDAAGIKETIVESMGPQFQAIKTRPTLATSKAQWSPVTLPNDWRIKVKPDPAHPEASDYPKSWQGFFQSGVAWYRKVFATPSNTQAKTTITFEGVAGYSDYWFNGFWLGQQSTGYTPVTFDLSEHLRSVEEGPNVLLVRSDSTEAEGWWYDGGGIYRHVWLDTYDSVYIDVESLHVRTPLVSPEKAVVSFRGEVVNESDQDVSLSITIVVSAPSSGPASTLSGPTTQLVIPVSGVSAFAGEIELPQPQLWQIGNGQQYSLTARIIDDKGKDGDSVSTLFGIRTIEWTHGGVLVNGTPTKIYGGNLHQDWAVYGVGLPDRIMEHKLELCAEMGINAIRSAHHAPSTELVDHADRMGMLVLLENRLFAATPAAIGQLQNLVKRFRNRPSVFMWSIENEEMDMQASGVGRTIVLRMVREIKHLDPDRATIFGGVIAFDDVSYYSLTDVIGMHYRSFFGVLNRSIEYVPSKPHVLDEEGLYASTRGVYQYDKKRAHAGSLSTLRDVMMDAPSPGANAALMPVDYKITGNVAEYLSQAYSHPKLSGCFVWSALDYIGEPTPRRWPATSSSYGGKDLIGLPKDYYWLLRSLLRPEDPLVHVFPHWTWPGREGERLQCRGYSNCDEVEFAVNGTVVARHPVKDGLVVVEGNLEYQPGELVARGFWRGKAVAEHRQVTSQQAARLEVTADRARLTANEEDACVIRVAVTDAQGNLIPDAELMVGVEVSGPGVLAGMHNADPSTDQYAAVSSCATFNGFVGVFVQTTGQSGAIFVTCRASGLDAGFVQLDVVEDEHPHFVHKVADEAQNKLFGLHMQI